MSTTSSPLDDLHARAATGTTALVFMNGRNCAPYVERAIASVARQGLAGVHVLFVDDASTDDTPDRARASLEALMPGRYTFRTNASQLGKAGNAGTHLRDLAPDATFIAVVDADDQLARDDVLELLAERYATGYDVVWTNYVTDQGDRGMNRALNPFAAPRGQGWVTSHLFSFRALLWERVPDSYLQDGDGRWLTCAADIAIAFPVLDQTRRYAFVPTLGYRYTVTNPASHHNQDAQPVTSLSSREQAVNASQLVARPALPCWRFPGDVPTVLHELITARLDQHSQAIAVTQSTLRQLMTRVDRMPYMLEARRRLVEDEGVPAEWLDNVGGWSLDVELLDRIAATLSLYESPHVMEMGSGAGTRVLATLVRNHGGRLSTLEHDAEWHRKTSMALEEAGLADTATVHLCPLVPVDTFGITGRFYDTTGLTDTTPYDVVIVDGPPTATNPLARMPALPAVSGLLNPSSFHVFLDDYERADEKRAVEMWRAIAPDLVYDTLTFAKAVAVVRSSSSSPVPTPGAAPGAKARVGA